MAIWRDRPRSLRARLSLLAVLVTAAFLALLTVGFDLLLTHQLRGGADNLLRTRAEASTAVIDINADGTLTLREPPQDRELDAGTWVYYGRTALQRPTANRSTQREADALAGTGEHFGQIGEPLATRLFALPLTLAGRQVGTVVTSVELDPYDRVEDLALVTTAALAGLVLVGTYLLTRALVGRALDPVTQMTQQAAAWGASDVGRRFGEGRRPTELAALAATLDNQLERLAAVLRHEQQLSAELSHELRTPLSALVAELDLLRSRPRSQAELTAGHEAIAHSAERMSRVLESLLTAARATSAALPGRSEVLPAVRAAINSIAAPEGAVTVRSGPPGLAAGVDPALLERALAPVLDNALRHARAHVVVELGMSAHGPWVSVQDDGPGVDPDLWGSLFEPGVRGTSEVDGAGRNGVARNGHGLNGHPSNGHSVTGHPSNGDGLGLNGNGHGLNGTAQNGYGTNGNNHDGSGLGLALARRLARAGGGELRLEPGPGGARFVLALPAA